MLIPKHTKCPKWDECRHAKDNECRHKGEGHPVEYSCGWLRFMTKMDEDLAKRGKVQIKSWSDIGELD